MTTKLRMDEFAPVADAALVQTIVVAAPAAVTFDAVYHLDLADVWRASLSLRALTMLRELPDKVGRRLRRDATQAPAVSDADDYSQYWVELALKPDHEVVYGLVGRFSGATMSFERVAPEEFAAFRQPGFAKVVLGYSVRPYGGDRSLLTAETRTVTADEVSRRAFLRYWRLIRVPVRYMTGRILEAARAEAETRPAAR
jgi:hypothetical protein